jgi:hypothetical protein
MLDEVQTLLDLAAQCFAMKILAEEDRLDCLAEFGKPLVSRVLSISPNIGHLFLVDLVEYVLLISQSKRVN